MNVGFLDRRITLQQRGTAVNDFGEPTGAWSDLTTVWAALDNKSASSNVQMEQETSINRVTWRIRSSSTTRTVAASDRVKYGSEYYNILAIQEVGRKNELYLVTERVVSE